MGVMVPESSAKLWGEAPIVDLMLSNTGFEIIYKKSEFRFWKV